MHGGITILLVPSKIKSAFRIARTALYLMNLSSINVVYSKRLELHCLVMLWLVLLPLVCPLRFSLRDKQENIVR